MGIQNLYKFLEKRAPSASREIHLSHYAGKRVAVDISGLIYKYKILNQDKWLDSFAYLVLALRRNRIHPVFIFDGEAPAEKDLEKSKRSQQKNLLKDKIFTFRQSLDNYYSSGESNDFLREEMKKLHTGKTLGDVIPINTHLLETRYKQIESQVVHWNGDEVELLHRIFDLSGIQYCQSPGEAETLCSSLALEGKVDAVISNDSDVLAYGVDKFLYKINGMTETCVEIDLQKILECLSFTREQFLDFCIMCGCDYNTNIPGVGCVNSYNLIREHKSIENLPLKYNTECLNYKRCRELFSLKYPCFDVILCNDPSEKDIIELYNMLKLKNSRIKIETIQKAFKPVEILFED